MVLLNIIFFFQNQSFTERWEDESCMNNWILKYTEFENWVAEAEGQRSLLRYAEKQTCTCEYLWTLPRTKVAEHQLDIIAGH